MGMNCVALYCNTVIIRAYMTDLQLPAGMHNDLNRYWSKGKDLTLLLAYINIKSWNSY